jgi:phosphoribosylformylglycinamidine cyclo-ligase
MSTGEYDLAGFAVGIVNRDRVLTEEKVQAGDKLVALASSGIHSNGYSLARRVLLKGDGGQFEPEDRPEALSGRTVIEAMMTPTRNDAKSFLALYERFAIHGAANITGGGLHENIPRMLPEHLGARIEWGTWPVPPIFALIERLGPVEPREMESTFNLGIGMVLAVPAEQAEAVRHAVAELGERAYSVGDIIERAGEPVEVVR